MNWKVNIRFLIVLFVSLFFCTPNVWADLCDSAHIKQLKELANQVDVSYEYIDNNEKIESGENVEIAINFYTVSINMLSDEFYVTIDGNDYYYSDAVDGILTLDAFAGNFKLEIKSRRCVGYLLRKISIDLPEFNAYSYRDECKKLEEYNLDVCNPWYQGEVNPNIFYETVNKYLVEEEVNFLDKIIDFVKKNYLIISGCCLGIIFIVILIIIHRKRSVLE